MTALKTAGFAHPERNIAALGIRPGMRIADFGAGSGAYVLGIAERVQGLGHVYAIDVQQELLRRIKNEAHKRGYKNVEIIWGDLEKPGGSKLADRHIDFVLVSNLLFQVEAKEVMLSEAWRILAPSGMLAIIDWSESFGGMGPVKKDVVKKEKAIELAGKCGFEFWQEFDAGAHHYGLLFRPKMRDNTNV
jgi:ubiquinone/menaquinone biosynthesis C-methylase UbiE